MLAAHIEKYPIAVALDLHGPPPRRDSRGHLEVQAERFCKAPSKEAPGLLFVFSRSEPDETQRDQSRRAEKKDNVTEISPDIWKIVPGRVGGGWLPG